MARHRVDKNRKLNINDKVHVYVHQVDQKQKRGIAGYVIATNEKDVLITYKTQEGYENNRYYVVVPIVQKINDADEIAIHVGVESIWWALDVGAEWLPLMPDKARRTLMNAQTVCRNQLADAMKGIYHGYGLCDL